MAQAWIMVLTVALAACAKAGAEGPLDDDAGTDTSTADAKGSDVGPGGPVFVAPTDARDRIGIYAWGFDDTTFPGTGDRLNWAAGKVKALGTRTLRVYLGPQDVYKVLSGATDSTSTAKSPAYASLFADPAIATYLLTTYSKQDDAGAWTTGFSSAAAAAERQEIADLGKYLLATYPAKSFVLLNWEGDNAIAPVAMNAAAWDGFVAWIQSRAQGVADARMASPSSSAHLYSGVEFNSLRSLTSGAPCDDTANKCIISYAVPKLDVDYYSYSSWQSMGDATTTAQLPATLQGDLDAALVFARKRDPQINAARFIVGEFGTVREGTTFGECAVAQRAAAAVTAMTTWGVSYGVFWQIIDNTEPATKAGWLTGFGLYKATGEASIAESVFQALYSTQLPTLPMLPSCPIISQKGIVNGVTVSAPITSSGIISIYGAGFSAPNVVHIRENAPPFAQWDIKAGSPNWYEGASQINATLPGVGANMSALVFVTAGTGVDTNGQVVTIAP